MNEESVHEVAPQNNEATDRIIIYDSEQKIEETKNRINAILKDTLKNEVFVFDFGHYYYDEAINNNDEEDKHFLFNTVIKGSKKYIETLFPEGKDTTTDYRYFESSIREGCNISQIAENDIESNDEKFETPITAITSKKPFITSEWAETLAKKKIGGCLLVSSIKEGNHQSAVWVVLKKPIIGFNSYDKTVLCYMSCDECKKTRGIDCDKKHSSDKRLTKIFEEIDKLLSNELVHNTELEIYRQSIRAAISQVFVHNLAHNLVPNVLEHLRDADSISFFGLCNLLNNSNAYTSHIDVPLNDYNQQVANVFSYVADRCKYLNEAIYGVVKEEKNTLVYGELFRNLDANRILLNHISGKKIFKYRILFMYNGEFLNDDNDIYVSLPAGVLGAQAFYIILENIISNTAQHNNYQNDVQFTVNFIDDAPLDKESPFIDENKYYRVEIWDNVLITMKENYNEEIENIKKKNQYVSYFGLTKENETSKTKNDADNISVSCADNTGEERIKDAADLLVYKQNTQLNKTVIDPKNRTLRSGSLGLIEMEVSAAFLRQEDLPEIDSDKYDLKDGKYYNQFVKDGKCYPYFIQAFKHKLECNNGFSLGYRFYMKKPEEFEMNDNKIV